MGGVETTSPLRHPNMPPLKQFQKNCAAVFPGKARSAFPGDLRKNEYLERFCGSIKSRTALSIDAGGVNAR
jgi:hypothetical protein